MSKDILLVGDIGGTNARFALAEPDTPGYRDEQVLLCADYDTPEQAIRVYLERVNVAMPSIICLAAAGPVRNGSVDLTNNNWHIREHSLNQSFGIEKTRLLNDFEAIAYSLEVLKSTEMTVLGLHSAKDLSRENFTVAVVGPGTGLGAAALLKRDKHIFPIVTEAGHVGFAPENAIQRAVWEILRDRFGRVSDERLVSGKGLENIYTAFSEIHDVPSYPLSAADIFRQVNSVPLATESVNLFFEILGQVAGNFVLATSAFDGLYIAGGIVQRYPALLANSPFRTSFENKGRHRHLLEHVPTLLVNHAHPGLLGASMVAGRLVNE
jgi:glucokinase